jgi:hypothetical protein
MAEQIELKKCKYCNKIIKLTNINKYYYDNLKYCSKECSGKVNGLLAAEVNKRNKTSMCFDKKLQRKGGKSRVEYMKKNKTNFYDFKIQSMGGKIGGKKAAETNRKNGTGLFNPDIHSIGGKASHRIHPELANRLGLSSQHTLRINIRNLKQGRNFYDSKPEIEISICLQEQFGYFPKENKTLHFKIGTCEYDYLLEKLKLFIEYHPWFQNITEEEYYNKRRDNLNVNGYKDYNLVIIK